MDNGDRADEKSIVYTLLDVADSTVSQPSTSTPGVRGRAMEQHKFDSKQLLESIDFDSPKLVTMDSSDQSTMRSREEKTANPSSMEKGDTVLVYRKTLMKPGKFDGTGSLESFLTQFEICARHNQWTAIDKVDFLRCALDKAAVQLLWDVGARSDVTYEELTERLRQRYGAAGQAETFCAQLYCRRQRADESLSELLHDIQRLAVFAYPLPSNETTEIIARDAFLEAIRDRELSLKVGEREPKTLDEAYRMALQLEADQRMADPEDRLRPHNRVRATQGSDWNGQLQNQLEQFLTAKRDSQKRWQQDMEKKIDRQLAVLQNYSGTREEAGQSFVQTGTTQGSQGRTVTCYNCGRYGHFARRCRQPRQRSNGIEVTGPVEPDGPPAEEVAAVNHTTCQRSSNNASSNMIYIRGGQNTGHLLTSGGEDNHEHDSEDYQGLDRPSFGGVTSVINTFVKSDASANNSSVSYAEVAQRLMKKMGHQEGKGLGKHGQGIVAPVEASKQKGRRGLGHEIKGLDPSGVGWDFTREAITIEETVDWIPQCQLEVPSIDELKKWVREGDKKLSIDNETNFCSKDTLDGILSSKSVFDNLEPEEMRKARTKSNPYETIRGAFFLNRAAMKMANMDAVLDFMFTNPKDEEGRSLIGPNELLYFADICAGPGGFSEYVLWRKSWHAKGFGFTLKGPSDFKLEDFFAAPSELFEPHYGVHGPDGDGDIYRPDNLREFQNFVLAHTDGKGVHFVMADGGFSVDGQENIQEILSKRLYLCQFLCALMILRPGGNFVCKLFDLFTTFSVGLVYLLYRAFNHVAIFKPVTSRPANSERYIICQGRRADSLSIQQYLFNLNLRMCEISPGVSSSTVDITEVVPLDIIHDDDQFFQYIYNSNEVLGQQQVVSLVKIKTFARNTDLRDLRQSDVREKCLKRWEIPDELRTAPDKSEKPADKFNKLTKESAVAYQYEPTLLTTANLPEKVKSIYDYRCIVSGAKKRYILISLGKSHIYRWDTPAHGNGKWQKVEDLKLEIPRDTILEVEFVEELRGEGKGQRRVTTLHILDAIFLCGIDVRDLHFNDRIEKAKKFVKAISRATRSDLAPIRVKDPIRFEQIESVFQNLQMKVVKGGGHLPKLCYCCHEEGSQSRFLVPNGLFFIKIVSEPWMMAMSKSQNRKYYFNTVAHNAVYETPKDSIATVQQSLKTRLFWSWDGTVRIHDEQQIPASNTSSNGLSKNLMLQFVHEKLH